MIQSGGDYGGPKCDDALWPIQRQLNSNFRPYPVSKYTDAVDSLSIIFRGSGSLLDFGPPGVEKLRWAKKGRYVTLDLVIAHEQWRDWSREQLLQSIDASVREAFALMVARLRKGKVSCDWDGMHRDFELAMEAFEQSMPHGGPADSASLPALPADEELADRALEPEPRVIKLYKRERGVLRYREAWWDGASTVEHWGAVGKKGRKKQRPRDVKLPTRDSLNAILAPARKRGYRERIDDELFEVCVEFALTTWGNVDDIDKRHRLEERLQGTLGWTGLGDCTGGSIGSGTMEVFCKVVDAEIALQVLRDDLRGTEFADFARVFDTKRFE